MALLSASVVASQAVVAGSVATVALLQPPAEGLAWLERCGAPYLAVDSQLRCHGDFVASEGDGKDEGSESPDW